MISRVFPWRYLLRRAAATHGVIDPLTILARIRRFSQPSDIQEPIELIRTGIERHAQGLVNVKAIQANMDWIWPYWIERQFRPDDPSFVPRGFTLTHMNLTHRDWTAVSMPDSALYPLVDPRHMVTPLFGGWSFEFWLRGADGAQLVPSKLTRARQRQEVGEHQCVVTSLENDAGTLELRTWMEDEAGKKVLRTTATGTMPAGGSLVLAIRPYNVEGVQFVEHIALAGDRTVVVNKETRMELDRAPDGLRFSDYANGDVFHRLHLPENGRQCDCKVGMATMAALYDAAPGAPTQVAVRIPLDREAHAIHVKQAPTEYRTWPEALRDLPQLDVPDARLMQVFRDCQVSLVQLSAMEIYPGPLTYRRFWFRDAALMLHGLLTSNMLARSRRAIDGFFHRQKSDGYFHSQEGEWDSNGQVLWIMHRYSELAGGDLPEHWRKGVIKGAEWICRKRLRDGPDLHRGLLPVGFSAEHFGSTDFYYWDDFWAVGGLRGAAAMLEQWGDTDHARRYRDEADALLADIFRTLDAIEPERGHGGAMPTGPYRRMDAAAVGALVADWPLQLLPRDDPRVRKTCDFLLRQCFYKDALFHDLSHAGLNIYLTLAIGQSLLRLGDERWQRIVRSTRDLASPTGHWAEAIHPRTLCGSMGDGQHGWASSEFTLMVRSLFVREEADTLVLLPGLMPEWLREGVEISYGPTATRWGQISVKARLDAGTLQVHTQSNLRSPPRLILVAPPGFQPAPLLSQGSTVLHPEVST